MSKSALLFTHRMILDSASSAWALKLECGMLEELNSLLKRHLLSLKM